MLDKNQKSVLAISIIGSIVFLSFLGIVMLGACGTQSGLCKILFSLIAPVTFIFPSVLVFSLVTLFATPKVFHSWFSFVKWGVPLSIILTVLTPETTGSVFLPFYGRGHVALATSILFVIISIGIIGWKHLRSRS